MSRKDSTEPQGHTDTTHSSAQHNTQPDPHHDAEAQKKIPALPPRRRRKYNREELIHYAQQQRAQKIEEGNRTRLSDIERLKQDRARLIAEREAKRKAEQRS
eukprot:c15360_g1_i1.p3 GENE.c15360_g1_i1~~c15360_g1_i1.p3  ORF type:complete len:102 (-),score=11.59 c15360_g1_i1:166-471(-)